MNFYFKLPLINNSNLNNSNLNNSNLNNSNLNNSNSNNSNLNNSNSNKSSIYFPMKFREFPYGFVPPPIPSPSPQPQQLITNTVNKDNVKKMLWGKPTWFLFHTIAEKVNESHFLEIRSSLLDIIYSICINLPCPKCAEHAKLHLNGINFNTIQTKEDLKLLFFDFHNLVNKKNNYEIFTYESLDQYKYAVTKNIIFHFLTEFVRKSRNIRYLSDDLHRDNLSKTFYKWFNQNWHYFSE